MAKDLVNLGFSLVATRGTARVLRDSGFEVREVNKVLEGSPHCVDEILSGRINLVFNTTEGAKAIADSHSLRRATLMSGISYFTTVRAGRAAIEAIAAVRLRFYARESTAKLPPGARTRVVVSSPAMADKYPMTPAGKGQDESRAQKTGRGRPARQFQGD